MSVLPGYEDALAAALAGVAPITQTEDVPLAAALGRVLRETIVADRDLPPFDRAQMDGYAVRGAELASRDAWPVVATIAAGQPADVAVPPGSCVAIATGAPLPADVDTVVQHELSDRNDPVRLDAAGFACGHAVHPRGADARAGDELLIAGARLGAHHLGIAATVGRGTLRVTRGIRAVVLSSGDELVEVDVVPAAHQIRNSNGVQTLALLRRVGVETAAHHHVLDEREPTIERVRAALAEADLLVTIGGVSAGDRDHFPAAFDAARVETLVHKASIQPGKPILIGRAPASDGAKRTAADAAGPIVVALPGNPVSSLACFSLFAWPIVRQLGGASPRLPWRMVTLDEPVRPNPNRRAFRPGRLVAPDRAVVPRWAGSGDLVHTAPTDGLIALPVQRDEVPAGAVLPFLPWP